jgi:hypothetical protein
MKGIPSVSKVTEGALAAKGLLLQVRLMMEEECSYRELVEVFEYEGR